MACVLKAQPVTLLTLGRWLRLPTYPNPVMPKFAAGRSTSSAKSPGDEDGEGCAQKAGESQQAGNGRLPAPGI